jgi:hypothetical protein
MIQNRSLIYWSEQSACAVCRQNNEASTFFSQKSLHKIGPFKCMHLNGPILWMGETFEAKLLKWIFSSKSFQAKLFLMKLFKQNFSSRTFPAKLFKPNIAQYCMILPDTAWYFFFLGFLCFSWFMKYWGRSLKVALQTRVAKKKIISRRWWAEQRVSRAQTLD